MANNSTIRKWQLRRQIEHAVSETNRYLERNPEANANAALRANLSRAIKKNAFNNRKDYNRINEQHGVDSDDKWPYPITFRSFHPSKYFGRGNWFTGITTLYTPYKGDERGFSLADDASSRIKHRVVADPQKGTATYAGKGKLGTRSDVSHHKYFGKDKDNPNGYIGRRVAGENSISFETGYEGTNPLAPGPTPDIDVDARLSLVQKSDILYITGQVAGDDFPNTEAFIRDSRGQKVFLGTDTRAPGEDQNPTILFGPATEQIMNINIQIHTNPKNGNFIGVMDNGRWVKLDVWNQKFLK